MHKYVYIVSINVLCICIYAYIICINVYVCICNVCRRVKDMPVYVYVCNAHICISIYVPIYVMYNELCEYKDKEGNIASYYPI